MARNKRDIQEINAGSMADIAFLLLVFFLVTTTMDTSWGLARKLPPPILENQPPPPPIKDRNVFVVLANSNDQLLVEGQLMQIGELRAAAKEFIANPRKADNLPDFKDEEVPYFGNVKVSKQVISLQNDRGTSYDLYIQVQNELAAAYTELREELSSQRFGKGYQELEELAELENAQADEYKKMIKAIRKIYPQRISEAEPKDVGT